MKDPIKIIHKFKNNNRRIQYKIYIFIGQLVPEDIINILNIIQNKDLFSTFELLSQKQYNKLVEYYGEFWYEKFFLSHHIENQKKIINTTIHKKNILEVKYNKEWYKKHIIESNIKKIFYSYAASYYNYLLISNKIKPELRKQEIDFRTYRTANSITFEGSSFLESNPKEFDYTNFDMDSDEFDDKKSTDDISKDLKGGAINDDDDDIKDLLDDNDDNDDDNDDNEDIISDDQLQEQIEDEFDLDEISKLYATNIETSKSVLETSKLISDAINDKKWIKEISLEKKYDNSMDDLNYEPKLEDIYNKYYITDQYILKDETIKTIKQKISVSIPISNKFGEKIKILPETQYLWSEYKIENLNKSKNNIVDDHVMLGQKWIRRNELLKIDIIPNDNIKVYEKLRNNLGYLKDNFGHKIKREDDELNILRSYENFITMNEIYMIDIYNELGINYNPNSEEKKNLYDVYINIYYPLISFERLEQIIQLLNRTNNKELLFIEVQFGIINNDIKLENEIEYLVESTKLNIDSYNKFFLKNYIIQSIIHVNIQNPKNITGTITDTKFNLYRIFDNFIVNSDYPFIQYQSADAQLTYKYYTKTDKNYNQELLSKWFENAPYGISFKIKTDTKLINIDKYISINLHETGRIEYKITWKEEDKATIEDINETYTYVRNLLEKINSENKKIKIILPTNDKFKYAFINTILKFTIPDNYKINHNDLSEFSRFFFTYISLVIEPKKRVSKKKEIDDISKYGTYLRYKRISKYDNRIKMHLRILYFLKNYELNDRELIDELAKQFNITMDVAAKELDYVREKYQKIIKKSKKILKKLKALPKSKPPGIGIDIQGRDRDKYKIRITGARNKEQLDDILDFIKVLIYLYIETYLYKKKEYQKIKDKLKNLTKIAKRRNKVLEIVDYEKSNKSVKTITSLDKARLGFKPEKGQNQWTRSCQNSGNDKKRRPEIYKDDQLDNLIKEGYKLNELTGFYEKKIDSKSKNDKKSNIIKAIKLSGENNTYNYFTCNPTENKEYIYVGFLSRGNNPNNLCMPCCFKKDQLESVNKEKKNYYLKCIGDQQKNNAIEFIKSSTLGDKVYILQDTNKIQEGRFIYLPKYLDIFFNKIWKNDNKIVNHYLLESKSGYFFKYTVKHDYYYFLIALSNIYELSIELIIEKFIDFLQKDKNNKYFTYLNNGLISESFKNKEKYIEFIKISNYLEYDIIGELSAIPNVLSKNGIIYFILTKKNTIIKKILDKDEIKEEYYLECLNIENYQHYEQNRDIIILLKEDKYYFPIYKVQKNEKINKKFNLIKIFSNNKSDKLINELKNYNNKSCKDTLINNIFFNYNLITKNIIQLLENNKIIIKNQYIDDKNKCKYIRIDNDLLLPTKPSGISYEYPFENIRLINKKVFNLNTTIKLLATIEKILNLDYIPKSIYYDNKDKNKIRIISILLNNNLTLPILNEFVNQNEIKKLNLSIIYQSLEETIDYALLINKTNMNDTHLKNVKEHNYISESYKLYKLELSYYLSQNNNIKDKIIDIVRNSNKIDKDSKKSKLRNILFKILNKKLSEEIQINKEDKIKDDFSVIIDDIPNLEEYNINNIRDYCNINKNKETCNLNLHCKWKNDSCKLRIMKNLAINFVNKVIEEILYDDIRFKEIIQENNCYVSDIVDYTQYTNRIEQKIIKSSNFNINKLMSELFGKDKIPILGKRQFSKQKTVINEFYPELVQLGKQYIQEIIPNKDSLIRAYVNSYYWINNPLYDIESRNLGYNNDLQTTITYLFKANIIDFIQNIIEKNDNINSNEIKKYLKKYFKNNDNFFESTLNKFRKTSLNTDGLIELYILSYLINLPIIVYDNYSNVKSIFLQGEIEINKQTIKNFTSDETKNKSIFIKLNYENLLDIPKNIYSIYYI
uniref:Early transcription factor VETF large subunit n=1 Tax=viral metagenome TaxID=1070528 RepID=A0A6C0EDD6_9ZZZZ